MEFHDFVSLLILVTVLLHSVTSELRRISGADYPSGSGRLNTIPIPKGGERMVDLTSTDPELDDQDQDGDGSGGGTGGN